MKKKDSRGKGLFVEGIFVVSLFSLNFWVLRMF